MQLQGHKCKFRDPSPDSWVDSFFSAAFLKIMSISMSSRSILHLVSVGGVSKKNSNFLGQARGVKGQGVPMGDQNFKIGIFQL